MPINEKFVTPELLPLYPKINEILLKCFEAPNFAALTFIITNDTIELLPYDRAILWTLEDSPRIAGISGLLNLQDSQTGPVIEEKLTLLFNCIQNPTKHQILNEKDFASQREIWEEFNEELSVQVIWLPIFYETQLIAGLWIERWDEKMKIPLPEHFLDTLTHTLMPGYGLALERFSSHLKKIKQKLKTRRLWPILLLILLAFFLIRVPLRVVAPCEVVPKEPFVVTAPLEGVIEKIEVDTGDTVQENDVLAQYEIKSVRHDLSIAEKELETATAEYDRQSTLALDDPKAQTELAISKFKLEKAQLMLEYAKYKASRLQIKAPNEGIVMINNPEDWQGKPVKIGEKILTIGNPKDTRIHMWIPESDNVTIDYETPIKVLLSIYPLSSYKAKIVYIASESSLSDKQIVSFESEADWVEVPPDVKIGLRGTAVLYGEDVSLFYYIFRKPWNTIRTFIGI